MLKYQATEMSKYDQYTKMYMRRAAIIVAKPVHRVLLHTLFQFKKPVAEYGVFNKVKTAQNYLKQANLQIM
jgi:hypothetical protein